MTAKTVKTLIAGVAVSLLLLVYTPAVYAYLDPSTGSMIVSALVGIFASLALALKTYWYKVKKLFRQSEPPKSSENPSVDP